MKIYLIKKLYQKKKNDSMIQYSFMLIINRYKCMFFFFFLTQFLVLDCDLVGFEKNKDVFQGI